MTVLLEPADHLVTHAYTPVTSNACICSKCMCLGVCGVGGGGGGVGIAHVQAVIYAHMFMCVRVYDEMHVSVGLCKRPRLIWDGML